MAINQKTIQWRLSRKAINPVYMPYIENYDARYQIFYGGSSSGKSLFIAQRGVRDILKGGRNYLVLRNTANTLLTSVFNELEKIIDRFKVRDLFHITKSPMMMTCKVNGYQILFGGLDDLQKVKSLTPRKGVLTDIWLEEATEAREVGVIKELDRRMRGGSEKIKKRLTMSFNPMFKTHWIYDEYFAGNWNEGDTEYHGNNLSILKTTYKDNRFLTSDDIEILESEKDEYFYNVYTLGNWGVLGDLVFKNWKIADLSALKNTFDNYRNGLDFGFCVDDQTEILTKSGWKKHNDLTISDYTLTINKTTGLSEWQQINEVNRFNGRFDMRLIEGQSHSSLSTHNHRWLIEPRPETRIYKRRFKTTDQLCGGDVIACARKCNNLPKRKKYTDNFVELAAWFWTEGQITKGGISLWQNEGEYADRIRKCLKNEYGEQITKTRNGRNRAPAGWVERPLNGYCCHWAININGAQRFLDIAPNKNISPEFIMSLTYRQLLLFIDISIKADGSTTNGGTRVICQSKKERLESMQIACSLVGIRTTLRSARKSTEWRLTLFKNNDKLYIGELIKRRPSIKKIIYKGLVWCPTTDNGTWLARRNGTVYFTGNTNDPTAYVRTARSCDKKTLYILDCFYEYGLTNPMIASRLRPLIANETIRCDSAEPKSIMELTQHEINAIGAIKGPGSVNYGIQWLQQFDCIAIHKELQDVVNEFTIYQFKKNKDGKTLNEPVDANNHVIDGTRYAWSDEYMGNKPGKRYTKKDELGIF